jgi:citrate synthase
VQRLAERQALRRHPEQAARRSLHWGTPILESGLTLIADGRLYYRGHDAAALAINARFEQVASLLWGGELAAGTPQVFVSAGQLHLDAGELPERSRATSPLLADVFQVALARAALADPARYDLRPAAVAQAGARILYLLTSVVASDRSMPQDDMARALQKAWAPSVPQAQALLNAALVLCADHELNVSSFTARCVASAGSTPYAAVIAGLAALQGTRHGGYTERVEALLREAASAEHAKEALAARLRRGESIPGFGHPLYPDGDPRGRLLLDMTAEVLPGNPAVALAAAVEKSALDLIGERPTIDVALAVLTRSLELADGTALALFALGRTAGWIAHAIEQYQTDQLIRPRARYVGPLPVSS